MANYHYVYLSIHASDKKTGLQMDRYCSVELTNKWQGVSVIRGKKGVTCREERGTPLHTRLEVWNWHLPYDTI